MFLDCSVVGKKYELSGLTSINRDITRLTPTKQSSISRNFNVWLKKNASNSKKFVTSWNGITSSIVLNTTNNVTVPINKPETIKYINITIVKFHKNVMGKVKFQVIYQRGWVINFLYI